jgi:phage repressor protein C with HTH and peptisase S24 domain
MFTHSDIWRAIDRLASTSGFSASGLAKAAGLDPTTFNKSKRTGADGKPRWPSTESIAKILSVTGTTMTDFMSLIEDTAGKPLRPMHQIPLIGMAQVAAGAGSKGYFDDAGYPVGTGWDEVSFPEYDSTVNEDHVYALEITGDSMEPVYRNGDVIVLAPGAKLRRGDRIVLRTKGGEVMAKELVKQSASKVELKSLNPAHDDRVFPMEDIVWMARIMWVSQ